MLAFVGICSGHSFREGRRMGRTNNLLYRECRKPPFLTSSWMLLQALQITWLRRAAGCLNIGNPKSAASDRKGTELLK